MNKCLTVLLLSMAISGCVTTPVKDGVGDVAEKNFRFPKIGQKIHVISNGIVLMDASYKSGYKYKLVNPLSLTLGFGAYSVQIDKNEELVPSILDGKEVHCTTSNSMRQLIGMSSNRACLAISGTKATHLKYAPSAHWFTKEFEEPIEVSRREVAVNPSGTVTKTELIYQGSTGGKIMFLRKDFGENLEIPKSAKPIIVDIKDGGVEILGARITVENANSNSLTYTIDSW